MEHESTDGAMRGDPRPILFVLSVLGLITIGGCGNATPVVRPEAALTVQDLVAQIDAALPKGTENTAVLKWLDSRKIEHSGYIASEQIVNAIWRHVAGKGVTARSIRADFRFSTNGKLQNVVVRDAFTGL